VMPSPHIAIVDDDAGIRKALCRLLTISGYGVEAFASADEALKAMPASGAALAILDCEIGEASGVDLARNLGAAGLQAPVIFMTGSSNDSLGTSARSLGCIAFLRKPFDADALLEAIAKATGGQQDIPE